MFKGFGDTPEEIGREFGIEYVLLGSVNRSNRRMRVVTQLVETRQGHHIWADKFDCDVEDIFDFQDQVTQMTAARLAVHVEGIELSQTRTKETADLGAYGLVLHAQESFFTYTKEGNRTARLLFERTLERDPKYARAYAALSRTHIYDWRYLWTDNPEDSFRKAQETAETAVRLDESDARGYAELAFVYLWSKEIETAIRLYQRALLLNPNSADIMAELADALAYAGRLADAENMMKTAMRLNPYYPDWYLWYLGDIYYGMGKYRDVIAVIEKMRDRSEGHRLLTAAHAMLGDTEKASRFANEVLKRQPDFSVGRWAEIQPDMDASIQQQFVAGLIKAGLPR